MYSITRKFKFSYGHRLQNVKGKCGNLHGHNAKVRITLASDLLDQRGMIVDFNEFNDLVGNWIDQNLDHKTILCQSDPLGEVLRKAGVEVFFLENNPTSEAFAKLIFEKVHELGLPVMEVEFRENDKNIASYWDDADCCQEEMEQELEEESENQEI